MKNSVQELSRAFLKERLKDPSYRRFYEEEQLRAGIGEAVKSIRKKKKLTSRELASRAGLPESTVLRIEKGEHKRWTMKLLQQIAAATGSRVQIQFIPAEDK